MKFYYLVLFVLLAGCTKKSIYCFEEKLPPQLEQYSDQVEMFNCSGLPQKNRCESALIPGTDVVKLFCSKGEN